MSAMSIGSARSNDGSSSAQSLSCFRPAAKIEAIWCSRLGLAGGDSVVKGSSLGAMSGSCALRVNFGDLFAELECSGELELRGRFSAVLVSSAEVVSEDRVSGVPRARGGENCCLERREIERGANLKCSAMTGGRNPLVLECFNSDDEQDDGGLDWKTSSVLCTEFVIQLSLVQSSNLSQIDGLVVDAGR